MSHFRRVRACVRVAACFAVLLFPSARFGRACSICRCGDPTFNALGNNVYGSDRLHLAIDWDRFNKTQGVVEDSRVGTDREIEDRITATVSYAFAERVVAVVRVPYSFRNLTTTSSGREPTRVRTDGLSDPELYALVRLWSSAFGPGLGRRAWISAVAGVKTNWGLNEVGHDGLRVDEHAQPGTGSTDLFGGLSGFYLFNDHSSLFASTQYRGTGRNRFGYKYGNIEMASVAYEHKIVDRLDTVVELDFRHSLRYEVDATGRTDLSTGGSILYLTPRVIFEVIPGVVFRLAAQVPVAKGLYGTQTEKVNINAGLTLLF